MSEELKTPYIQIQESQAPNYYEVFVSLSKGVTIDVIINEDNLKCLEEEIQIIRDCQKIRMTSEPQE